LGTVGLHRVDAWHVDIEKLFMSLIERLKNPEDHYELTDPKKANAVLMSLCQEAADALAAPVQEPVAFVHNETGLLRQANRAKGGDFEPRHWTPLYTTTPAAKRQHEDDK